MAKLMAATSDPTLMSALQSSMSSPASLRDASVKDPKVKAFLDDIWGSLGMDDGEGNIEESIKRDEPPSGLEAIQKVMGDIFAGKEQESPKTRESIVDVTPTPLPLSPSSSPPPSNDDASVYASLSNIVTNSLESEFKPEFLNRLDDIIVFKPLGNNELTAIASNLLSSVAEQAKKEKNVVLDFSQSLMEAIVNEGSSSAKKFGARPMKRTISRYVEDGVSDALISGFLNSEKATLDVEDDTLIIRNSRGEIKEHKIVSSNGIGGSAQLRR
eukprot:CAMPEP_0118661326 /NCGR_PEP_ID=MMETSP0785-20121206/16214_1 /TAXON_ID=91992 /ORGANISM="Bolidomonas pacifica, Strain CCMP 1866" /LENGTH=270 /DNA_ID=CAMNT_0006554747 /DNA_START=60 /DNA_END=869 /DNA_ORIENTATION=+